MSLIAKSKMKRYGKTALMLFGGMILTSVMIDAADNYQDPAGSLLGSVILRQGGEGESKCPDGMVLIDTVEERFCLDTYTASAGEDCPHSLPAGAGDTRANLSHSDCQPVSRPEAEPWRYISQSQAQEACQSAGKFLPDGRRWYTAARGTPSDPPFTPESCHLDNNWGESPGLTGSGADCVSHSGSYDQVGNVWEWVDETVVDGRLNDQELPPPGFITAVDNHGTPIATDPDELDPDHSGDRLWLNNRGVRGVMRGGFFGSGRDGGVYSFHAEMTPDFVGRAVGFRCMKSI